MLHFPKVNNSALMGKEQCEHKAHKSISVAAESLKENGGYEERSTFTTPNPSLTIEAK
jgi:hypothetical protein